MLQAPYKYVVYKIRLVKSERDFFGNPISSDELDVIAKALENDLHQKEVFKFVHPKNGDVTYERRYMLCPMNGNTILLVGQMRRPLDMAKVRITLRSHYYKVPYVVLSDQRFVHLIGKRALHRDDMTFFDPEVFTDHGNTAQIRTASSGLPGTDGVLPDMRQGSELFLAHTFLPAAVPDHFPVSNTGHVTGSIILSFVLLHLFRTPFRTRFSFQ